MKYSLKMASASSSNPFFVDRDESSNQANQHFSSLNLSSATTTPSTQKRRRNQPGTPNPNAEVIAMSPQSLMATNRFVCEVCNKGFQREQNLQLHRRGHNLPWKLKQNTKKEVKRRVYICPEPTCAHNDPRRALGDLTGIKKHYFRKHGEKNLQCEKCSKTYAVLSDLKAHHKICGTKQYKCECDAIFSRRDSFISHRAFCDALARQFARNHPPTSNTTNNHSHENNKISLGFSQVGNQVSSLQNPNNQSSDFHLQLDNLLSPSTVSSSFQSLLPVSSSSLSIQDPNQNDTENQSQLGLFHNRSFHLDGVMQFADLHSTMNNPSSSSNLFNLGFLSNDRFPNCTNSGNNANRSTNNNNSKDLPFSRILVPDLFNNDIGASTGSNIFPNDIMGDQINSGVPSLFSLPSINQNNDIVPHLSATALLQKAAHMGSSFSSNNNNDEDSAYLLRNFCGSSSSGTKHLSDHTYRERDNNLYDLTSSFLAGNSSHGGDANVATLDIEVNLHKNFGGSDRLTRDFLGVGQITRNISGGFLQREKETQHKPYQQDETKMNYSMGSKKNIVLPKT